MSQVVILGWDALDKALISEFGVDGQFGMYETKIETYCNPVIDHPHTKELWPSMITGLHPDEHGIHAVTESGGVNWDNPVIDTASNLANGVVPQRILSYIGQKLRERGTQLDSKTPAYYDENGLSTIFDDYGTPISIPNYWTEYDTTHGLDSSRDSVWEQLLADRDGAEGFDPDISTASVYDVLGEAMGRRLGHTIQAMQRGDSLVWTWFGLLDTVGHVDPAMDCDLQRDWYQVAANVTQTVQSVADDDTVVVSLSDHGLQYGEHTDYATLCSTHSEPTDEISHVFDVRAWIESHNPQGTERNGRQTQAPDTVTENLEGLGYI